MKILGMKNNNGFTNVDLSISIIIILIFVSLITTLFYNVYISSSATKRNVIANSYIVDIFEQIEKMEYEDIIEDSKASGEDIFLNTLNTKMNNSSIELIRASKTESGTKPYIVKIAVRNYNEIQDTNTEDIIKIIDVTVKYKVGKTYEELTSSRLKKKEMLYEDSLGIKPELVEGMIPVKYVVNSKSEGYWQTTTTTDSEWFDYANKKWANVMLQDGIEIDNTTGRVIKEGSMFVWIPRYAYKINTNYHHTNSDITTEDAISIKFLNTNNTCKDGTNTVIKDYLDTNYYTKHPAFTFGTKELSGIWVLKFEASNPNCTENKSTGEIDYDNVENKLIQSKPNVTSWRNISINNIYNICLNMTNITDYGFNADANKINTHMMNNTEWGACSYLAQSKFGKNTQIYNNNNSNFITGISANLADEEKNENIANKYNTLEGINASTTGNVTGVYDMAGGADEYVAAYVKNSNQVLPTNGNNVIDALNKYKDEYQIGILEDGQSSNYQTAESKFGDAIWETSNSYTNYNSWYKNCSNFASGDTPFFVRGGADSLGKGAGIFSFNASSGAANTNYGFRSCLIII